MKRNKYNRKKITVDNITFDSQLEYRYYNYLLRNKINFKMQVPFVLQEKFQCNGKSYREIKYIADFVILDENNEIEKVIDCKGMILPEFKMKQKLFAYRYGMNIEIVKDGDF